MWRDWTVPQRILLEKANLFTDQIDLSGFPRGGILIEPPEIFTRKEALAKAFAAFISECEPPESYRGHVQDFLEHYVYARTVVGDSYDLVFEYIGECEHAQDLNGDEFPPTREDLLDDFSLYICEWMSPLRARVEKTTRKIDLEHNAMSVLSVNIADSLRLMKDKWAGPNVTLMDVNDLEDYTGYDRTITIELDKQKWIISEA